MQRELPGSHARSGPTSEPLLGPDDPEPVAVRDGAAPLLLTVEHAGRAVPRRLGDLGLPQGEIDRHIGWDIGALDLAVALADSLSASVVAQRYSRVVIDSNRPWGADDLIPEVSDSTAIPANAGLSEEARLQRWHALHQPFHREVATRCDAGARALIAIHTYDPQRHSDAAERPWPIGLLWRQDNPLAVRLARRLAADGAALPLGLNEPYRIEDTSDFTVPVHCEARNLPHVLVEVRNDLVRDKAGVARMAGVLARACFDLEIT